MCSSQQFCSQDACTVDHDQDFSGTKTTISPQLQVMVTTSFKVDRCALVARILTEAAALFPASGIWILQSFLRGIVCDFGGEIVFTAWQQVACSAVATVAAMMMLFGRCFTKAYTA
jgi:hypothetical protein